MAENHRQAFFYELDLKINISVLTYYEINVFMCLSYACVGTSFLRTLLLMNHQPISLQWLTGIANPQEFNAVRIGLNMGITSSSRHER